MKVRRQTVAGAAAVVAHSTSERGIARGWTPGFIVEAGLALSVGDRVVCEPVPWGGVLMGGIVASYAGTLLEITIDASVGDGIFANWEIWKPGGEDFSFGSGEADYLVDSPEAVAQVCLTRLRLFVGEGIVDKTEGTPWFQAVLGVDTKTKIEPAMRSRILDTPGVLRIVDFEVLIDDETRAVTINGTITTEFGDAVLQGVL